MTKHILTAMQKPRELFLRYWKQLSSRDRIALTALSVLVGGLILLYAIVLPTYYFHKQAKDQFISQRELLGWLQAQQPLLVNLEQTKPTTTTNSASALSQITESVKKYGLSIKRIQPEGDDRIRIWMESVSASQTLNWLQALEKSGVIIDEISVEQDQQKKGMVNVRATLATN